MRLVLNIIGIIVVLAICWLLSQNRRAVNWKMIAKALLAEHDMAGMYYYHICDAIEDVDDKCSIAVSTASSYSFFIEL